jgi:hypothetical protein
MSKFPLITLDAKHVAPLDGKQVWMLEDYLAMTLKHPQNGEALRMNCASILRLLGVSFQGSGDKLLKRTASWLRANGYRAAARGKCFAVALAHPQACPHHVV